MNGQRLKVTKSARIWAAVVLMPFSAAAAYGLAFEANTRTLTLFRNMAAFVPLDVWAFAWAIVAVASFTSAVCGRPWAYQAATIGAAALSVGQFAATVWTRFSIGSVLTTVGISWAYLPAIVFTMSLIGMSLFPQAWLERDER